MNPHLLYIIVLIGFSLNLVGCKITQVINEGGTVQSSSGQYDCDEWQTCYIDVENGSEFNEVFTAIPSPGYEFLYWEKQDGYLCGGESGPCQLKDVPGFLTNQDIDTYLSPVFSNGAIPESAKNYEFRRHFDRENKISFIVPKLWGRSNFNNPAHSIVRYKESDRFDPDYFQETLTLYKRADSASVGKIIPDGFVQVSERSFRQANIVMTRAVYEESLTDRVNMFDCVNFDVNDSSYSICLESRRKAYSRIRPIYEHVVESIAVGIIPFDRERNEKNIAYSFLSTSGGSNVFLSCRHSEDWPFASYSSIIARFEDGDLNSGNELTVIPELRNVDCSNDDIHFFVHNDIFHVLFIEKTKPSFHRIYLYRLDKFGNIIDSNPVNISRNSQGTVHSIKINQSDQRTSVIWKEKYSLKGVFFDQNGNLSSVVTLEDDSRSIESNPSSRNGFLNDLAYADGIYLVTFSGPKSNSSNGYPKNIYAKLYNDQLIEVSDSPLLIRSDNGSSPFDAQVTTDGDIFLITWTEYQHNPALSHDNDPILNAKIVTRDGEILQGNDGSKGIVLNTSEEYLDGKIINTLSDSNIEVAYNGEKFIFVWHGVGSTSYLSYATFNASNYEFSGALPLISYNQDGVSRPLDESKKITLNYGNRLGSLSFSDDSPQIWAFDIDKGLPYLSVSEIRLEDHTNSELTYDLTEITESNVKDLFLGFYLLRHVGIYLESNFVNSSVIFVGDNVAGTNYTVDYSTSLSSGESEISFEFFDYMLLTFPGAIINGSATLSRTMSTRENPTVSLDLTIEYGDELFVSADAMQFQIYYRPSASDLFSAYNFHGNYRINEDSGYVQVQSEDLNDTIFIQGSGEDEIRLAFRNNISTISYLPNGNIEDSKSVRMLESDIIERNLLMIGPSTNSPFNTSFEWLDTSGLGSFTPELFFQTTTTKPKEMDFLNYFADMDGDLLTIGTKLIDVVELNDYDSVTSIAVTDSEYQLVQTGISKITFVSSMPGLYRFEVYAEDDYGSRSNSRTLTIKNLLDTDGDGYHDYLDIDDDADGYVDYNDENPKIPDIFIDPNDSAEEEIIISELELEDLLVSSCVNLENEDREICYSSEGASRRYVFDGDDTFYFFHEDNRDIARWSISRNEFIEPFIIGRKVSQDDDLVGLIYHKNHKKLYLGYSSGILISVNPGTQSEEAVVSIGPPIEYMYDIPNHLIVYRQQDHQFNLSIVEILDKNGELVNSIEGLTPNYKYGIHPDYRQYVYTYANVYDSQFETLHDYFFETDINVYSGQSISDTNKFEYPVAVSPDGDLSIRENGDIWNFNRESIGNLRRGIGGSFGGSDLFLIGKTEWTDAGICTATGSTVRCADLQFNIIYSNTFSKGILSLHTNDNSIYAVSISQSKDNIEIITIDIETDSDGDGVLNVNDRFPNDESVSVDRDLDGVPDQWNDGYSYSLLSPSMKLDSYPLSSDCYEDAHMVDGECVSTSLIPIPPLAQYAIDSNSVIYALFGDKIRRFSLRETKSMPSIPAGKWDIYGQKFTKANSIFYSESDHSLYLLYNFKITKIELGGSELFEKDFAYPDGIPTHGFASDEFIVIAQSESDNTRIFYTKEGFLLRKSTNIVDPLSMAYSHTSNRTYISSRIGIFYFSLDDISRVNAVSALSRRTVERGVLSVSNNGDYLSWLDREILHTSDGSTAYTISGFYYPDQEMWLSNDKFMSRDDSTLTIYNSDFSVFNTVEMDSYSSIPIFEHDGQLVYLYTETGDSDYKVRTISID